MANNNTRMADMGIELVEASKLIRFEEMFLCIAHELNNPSGIIKMISEYHLEQMDNNKNIDRQLIYSDLKKILFHIEKISRLITGIRKIGKESTSTEAMCLNVNNMLETIIDFLAPVLNKTGIRVELKKADPLCDIHADKAEIESVILNLLYNAIQALQISPRKDKNKRITIETTNMNNGCCFKVSDNGHGIEKERLGVLFQPLFSTEKEKNTCLGLSIVKRIVQKYHGTVSVNSETGKGTTFEIFFPSDYNSQLP